MMVKSMTYTKANGDVSKRKVIVVSKPKVNYLTYDVSELTDTEIEVIQEVLNDIDEFRNSCIEEIEMDIGIPINSLWRSFKPEGIEWD